MDDDNFIVGDIQYSRGQVDLIAKQILKNCNYSTDKNKNNNTRLLSGNGKLAITSGMTLNDFSPTGGPGSVMGGSSVADKSYVCKKFLCVMTEHLSELKR